MARRVPVLVLAILALAASALAAVYFANKPPSVLSRDEGLACIAERCSGPANACTTTVNEARDACAATRVADKCSTVEGTLNKMDCERDVRRECRIEAEQQVKTCETQGASCYASCGPMARDRPHDWCTGTAGDTVVSFFCERDPARPDSVLICSQRPEWQQVSVSLICTGL